MAYGAMFDPDPTQKLGGMSTGIGGAINSVYGPGWKANAAFTGNGISIARIGSPPPYGAKAKAFDFPAAVVTLQQNTGQNPVANTRAMPSGGTNQTGKPCPPGGMVFAIL